MEVRCNEVPYAVEFLREYELYSLRNGMHLFKKELC